VQEVYKILRTDCDADWYLVAAQDWGIFRGGGSTKWCAGTLRHAYSLGSLVTGLIITVEHGKVPNQNLFCNLRAVMFLPSKTAKV
jgi:hypothetical protein